MTVGITRAAMNALHCIWREGFRYAKASVVVPPLVRADAVQGSLFMLPDSAASQRLMTTLDGLNQRYGRGTVTFAGPASKQSWGLRSDHHSPRYTTSFKELLRV